MEGKNAFTNDLFKTPLIQPFCVKILNQRFKFFLLNLRLYKSLASLVGHRVLAKGILYSLA